jgi:hypothetical protein
MKRCLLFLLCILHGLSGEEESPISLVNQTKSPIPRAAGSVNIISGNWVDQSAHHATSGPDPYVVAHSYISSSLEEGTLADGWDFFHPSDLEVFQPKGIYYNRKNLEGCPSIPKMACHRKGDGSPANVPPPTWIDNEATLYYRDAGGATILFTGTGMATGFYPKLKNTGYLLVSSIDNPVRRDVKRTHVFWESASDHWVVKLGDGTRRIYARADKHKYRLRPDQKSYYKRSYHIKEEVLPSGNRRQYHYDADKELSSIRTLSSDKRYVLHSVAFHRKSDEVKVTTSEGITTHFSLKKLHDRETAYVVEKITRPGKARLSYAYSDKSSHLCSY